MNVAVFRSMALVFPKVNSGGAELTSSQWKQLAAKMPSKLALFGKRSKGRVITALFTIFLRIAQIEINANLKEHRKHGRNSRSVLQFVASRLLASSRCSDGCLSIRRPPLLEGPFPSAIRMFFSHTVCPGSDFCWVLLHETTSKALCLVCFHQLVGGCVGQPAIAVLGGGADSCSLFTPLCGFFVCLF